MRRITWLVRRKIDVVGERDRRFKRLIRHEDAVRVAASVYPRHQARRRCRLRGDPGCAGHRAAAQPVQPAQAAHGAPCMPAPPSRCSRRRSHVRSLVVADTDSWEQIAAKTFERLPAVESATSRTLSLGFEIPYVDKERRRTTLPAGLSVAREDASDEHFSPDRGDHRLRQDRPKRWFVQQRWHRQSTPSAKQLGLLPWHFAEVTEIETHQGTILRSQGIRRIATEVDAAAVAASAWAPSGCCWNS